MGQSKKSKAYHMALCHFKLYFLTIIYVMAKTIYAVTITKVTTLPAYYLIRKEVNTYFLSIRFPTIPTIFPIVKAARTVPIPTDEAADILWSMSVSIPQS